MIKRMICLLLCLGVLGLGSGCSQDPLPTETTTEAPFPTLDESRTPLELLQDAAVKTHSLSAFSLDYIRIIGEDRFALSGHIQKEADGSCTAETLSGKFTQEGVLEHGISRQYQGNICYEEREDGEETLESTVPYTLSQILTELREFNGRTGLIQLFCTHPLTVTPSYDGSYCYQLENLNHTEFSLLLCSETDQLLPEGSYAASLTVAPEGYLSNLEFAGDDLRITLTIKV